MPQTANANPSAVMISNSDDLAQLVKDCRTTGQPIVDYGLDHAGLGNPPPSDHIRLTQHGTVIEHYTGDLVVRAAAGITMGQLQTELNREGQFLPIDADDDITLGEVIMHNVYGPLRVGYGAMKELLLGMRYIDGLGRDIHVGGRTVKNVAGYDVTHFMAGSLGELGCVYEATLRTYAIPEVTTTVETRVDNPATFDAITTDLLTSDAAPTHLSLNINREVVGSGKGDGNEERRGETVALFGYFGHEEGCRVQTQALESFIDKQTTDATITHTQSQTLEQDAAGRSARHTWRRNAQALVKIIVPSASTGTTCRALIDWPEHQLTIDALPVHGCIFVGGNLDADAAIKLDQYINQVIVPCGGLRVWYARSPGADSIESFAPAQPDWPMLTKLKHAMDPHGIFNPGRFLPTRSANVGAEKTAGEKVGGMKR